MFLITVLILMLTVSPVLAGGIPDWVTNALNSQYTPIDDDADAILLYSDTELSYRGGKIKAHEKRIYKLNHLKGLEYGSLYVSGDKNTRISDVEGYRLNSSGQLLEEMKSDNIVRRAYNENFYDDAEQLYGNFDQVKIGNIVAFEYTTKSKPFFKQISYRFGGYIETGVMRVHVPEGVACHVMNDPNNLVKVQGNTYEVSRLPAVEDESWGPTLREETPLLGVVFERPSLGTWKSFSAERWQTTRDMTTLSPESISELSHLFSIKDKTEFIRETLKHVSSSVGYLDIEVGDGRFIPTACDVVHKKKYGDCKDMAYYALAILKQGGVMAHPLLARTKSAGPVFESFPAAQFNHVIIAVELDENSMELKNAELDGKPCLIADLTDRYTEPPMISTSLQNTLVLPVTEQGSNLVRIAISTPDLSVKEYDLDLKYYPNQKLTGTIIETLTGHFYTREKSLRANQDEKEKDKMYREWIQDLIPGASLEDVKVNTDVDGKIITMARFSAQNIGTDVNGDLFIGPNIVDAARKIYKQRKRETDLRFSYPYIRKIHVKMDVDPKFTIAKIPEAKSNDNEFFSFATDIQNEGQKVSMDCSFVLKTTNVTPEQYKKYRKLYKKYLKAMKSQVVLKKQ